MLINIFIFLFSFNVFSSISQRFDTNIFYPQDFLSTKICYEIHSPEITEMAQEKKIYSGDEKLIVQTCLGKESSDSRYKYDTIEKNEFTQSIFNVFHNKKEFVFPLKFVNFFQDFELVEDGSLIRASSEINNNSNEVIIYQKNKLVDRVIIKKAVGTTSINFNWKKFKWSKGKYVLTKISIDTSEGVQNVNSEISIQYHNLLNLGLPSKVTYYTIQNVLIDVDGKSETRRNKSVYYFDNYKII